MVDAELIGGPMSIQDIERNKAVKSGMQRQQAGLAGPGAPTIKRLPPKAGTVVRKKKTVRREIGDSDYYTTPSSEFGTTPGAESVKKAPEIVLPTFRSPKETETMAPELPRDTFEGDLQFKKPGETEAPVKKEKSEKKDKPELQIKMPGE